MRIEVVYHVVGKHEVHEGLSVHIEAKVFLVVPTEALTNAMGMVQHGCHSVKPKIIKATNNTPRVKS